MWTADEKTKTSQQKICIIQYSSTWCQFRACDHELLERKTYSFNLAFADMRGDQGYVEDVVTTFV